MALQKTYDLFIDGRWVPAAKGERLAVENPATGDVLAEVANGTSEDVDRAVAAAKQAMPGWSRRTATERADDLYRLIGLIKRDAEHLARTITREMGKPIREARVEVAFATDLLRFAAENTRRLEGEILPGSRSGEKILIDRKPVGVVGAIAAWNFPLALVARKLGPALAAGNAIVIKPHEMTPLAALELARLVAEADIPAGVVNIVTGDGPRVGVPLVAHPDTRLITMTGSTSAGKKIMAAAAEHLKIVRLELGGKAPFIVADDADIDRAVEAAVVSRFGNAGQVCTANERTYVDAKIYDTFAARLRARIEKLKVGDPLDEATDMGPKVCGPELEKVDQMVRRAVEQGAKLERGGARLTGGLYDRGQFYAPTLLTGVTGTMDIARNEVFGPVLSLIRVDSYEDAIRQANASRYGLSAYVFTNSLDRIMKINAELEFGEVYVNRESGESAHGFHHGYRDSGIGGEDGQHGLEAYVETQTIYLNA
ncbi:aldehyde dehydrogenase [Gluconacetobacter diazotrophicus]|uniref:Putative aldehyde dehydrogenase A n=1 Tax=Gluconacetobacter diazotrophicus (strain ATCC 49037 / DSM 5601 / CCUG 37298 / CIP 103539 / LMG 7603 / PAl5) TaxID=272568 RepID=A9HEG7_GLUDA|nr:aldehyde dehydrogenase [Gluconacetobacter diazotrophicus]CAP55230.1 putative aldehyde dehydrogenase A [Gluconacetobacter diazotrophicus PA1 5]